MVDRAKDLLLDIVRQRDTDATGLIDEVRSVLTTSEVTTYKNTGMTCGPNVEDSDALIIVEGRNDVMNLASCGIKNVIVLGVHTNMCVLGRPFSIRQMVYQGQNIASKITKELIEITKNHSVKNISELVGIKK